MHREAIAEFQKIFAVAPESSTAISDLAFAYASSGQKPEAQRLVEQLVALSQRKYVAPKNVAVVYASLGDKDAAFEWLEKAFTDRSLASGQSMKLFPGFDPLRSELAMPICCAA